MGAYAYSLVERHREMQCAHKLFTLGARVQVAESLLNLPRSMLLKLYAEINKKAPPKGQLPSSSQWFCQHEGNIHSSLFWNLRCRLQEFTTGLTEGEVLCKAYEAYLHEIALHQGEMSVSDGEEPLFSITRGWILGRFMRIGELGVTECSNCGGSFIYAPLDAPELSHSFVCSLCRPPSRIRQKV